MPEDSVRMGAVCVTFDMLRFLLALPPDVEIVEAEVSKDPLRYYKAQRAVRFIVKSANPDYSVIPMVTTGQLIPEISLSYIEGSDMKLTPILSDADLVLGHKVVSKRGK